MGAMLLSGADKIPHSVYESLVKEPVESIAESPESGDLVSGISTRKMQIQKVYREEPEEGLASTLVAAGLHKCLCTIRDYWLHIYSDFIKIIRKADRKHFV